jgi:dihydroorotate dehydrogenase
VAAGGADIIVAQGTEAGGHTGRIGTMALVPLVVDAVAPTPVVAAGGIADADDAWERIAAGATLVQLYTGFVYGGPTAPTRIAKGLAAMARDRGYARVQDAVGVAAARP